MSIPQTELVYSYPLNRLFIKDFSYSDLTTLKRLAKEFEKIYERNILRDLELIPKFTGFNWEKTYIPIYIVKSCPESISHPLILRYLENPVLMYVLLIHELVHNNIAGKIRVTNRDKLEAYVNAVVKEVLKQSPNATEILKTASQMRNWRKMLEYKINLTDKTLRTLLTS
jgi:hypothetical protein